MERGLVSMMPCPDTTGPLRSVAETGGQVGTVVAGTESGVMAGMVVWVPGTVVTPGHVVEGVVVGPDLVRAYVRSKLPEAVVVLRADSTLCSAGPFPMTTDVE
jgi:uncharacterized protein YbaR (Trm112 family)